MTVSTAYLLAQLLQIWTVDEPDREDVRRKIRLLIDKWSEKQEENEFFLLDMPVILFKLLETRIVPECQDLAVIGFHGFRNYYMEQ